MILEVPITPKKFFAEKNLCFTGQDSANFFFHFVETLFSYEFSKYFIFSAQPSEAKTGASDFISGSRSFASTGSCVNKQHCILLIHRVPSVLVHRLAHHC